MVGYFFELVQWLPGAAPID